jgi:hypothetical protein
MDQMAKQKKYNEANQIQVKAGNLEHEEMEKHN